MFYNSPKCWAPQVRVPQTVRCTFLHQEALWFPPKICILQNNLISIKDPHTLKNKKKTVKSK